MTPPKRFKDLEELTPEEHEKRQHAYRHNEPTPQFETDAYKAARAEELADHGLTDNDD